MTLLIRYVTVHRFAEATGYTEHAIRTKIRDGVWRDGQEWVKAPDGRCLIDIEGYNAWVASGSASVFRTVRGRASASVVPSHSSVAKGMGCSSPVPLVPIVGAETERWSA